MKLTFSQAPRSNSAVGFGSASIAFACGLIAYRIQFSRPQLASLIAFSGFSLFFFGIAFAQIRSGYLWRNLSPGNRGKHRSEDPVGFVASTILHVCVGLATLAFAIWRYFQPE